MKGLGFLSVRILPFPKENPRVEKGFIKSNHPLGRQLLFPKKEKKSVPNSSVPHHK